MTYVLQLAPGPAAFGESLIKSLHFMMLKYDLSKNPGQWRPGAIWIENEHGAVVYKAPEREQVDELMAETLAAITSDTAPAMVRAALAHLNLTLVHPFSDGNGRIARCVQTSVLASAGAVSPEFSSIDEYLGRNTTRYYEVLTEVAQGEWSPHRDAHPWVRFCLTAHYRQAQTLLRRIHETEALWDSCEQMVAAKRAPSRAVPVLCDSARGWRIRRSSYIRLIKSSSGEDVTDAMATRDLRSLVNAGLLAAVGEKRARRYEPTADLHAVWSEIRTQRAPAEDDDPYRLAEARH